MSHDSRPIIRIGHSPDPDDAFMWWPLGSAEGGQPAKIETGRFRFSPVLADIETLNQRSASGELEITAMSCAQYPFVKDRYVLTACGSSMGDGFGPKLVSSSQLELEALRGKVIAVPGERTSAFAAASLLMGQGAFRYEFVPFEEIIEKVVNGQFEAGLIIHEGQLTYQRSGLHLVVDLGKWWREQFELPLPLGVNTIRRDLDNQFGRGSLDEIAQTLLRSVRYALEHREEGLRFAMQFGRGIEAELADQFIAMYVNKWTLDFGPVGQEAVRRFLEEIHAIGLAPSAGPVDFISADPACAGMSGR